MLPCTRYNLRLFNSSDVTLTAVLHSSARYFTMDRFFECTLAVCWNGKSTTAHALAASEVAMAIIFGEISDNKVITVIIILSFHGRTSDLVILLNVRPPRFSSGLGIINTKKTVYLHFRHYRLCTVNNWPTYFLIIMNIFISTAPPYHHEIGNGIHWPMLKV